MLKCPADEKLQWRVFEICCEYELPCHDLGLARCLRKAIVNKKMQDIQSLLMYDAELLTYSGIESRNTPLHLALKHDYYDAVYLCMRPGMDLLHLPNKAGETPASLIAQGEPDSDLVRKSQEPKLILEFNYLYWPSIKEKLAKCIREQPHFFGFKMSYIAPGVLVIHNYSGRAGSELGKFLLHQLVIFLQQRGVIASNEQRQFPALCDAFSTNIVPEEPVSHDVELILTLPLATMSGLSAIINGAVNQSVGSTLFKSTNIRINPMEEVANILAWKLASAVYLEEVRSDHVTTRQVESSDPTDIAYAVLLKQTIVKPEDRALLEAYVKQLMFEEGPHKGAYSLLRLSAVKVGRYEPAPATVHTLVL